MPNSVTTIGNEAFSGCTKLTSVYFQGNSPTSFDFSVFAGDNIVTVYYLSGTTGWGPAFAGRPTVMLNPPIIYICTTNNGNITITKYNGFGGTVTIPDTINGLTVTSIGSSSFDSCTTLTYVTIPKSVTSIESMAFNNCTSLINVYFQGNAPSVGSDVFNGDVNTTVYYMAGTTGWGLTFGGRPSLLSQPSIDICVKTVQVTMHVLPGKKYQLQASLDLNTWTNIGGAFLASTSEVDQEFNAIEVGRYFRLYEDQ